MDNDLYIYINHIKNLWEDFNAWFKDLLSTEIPQWIISSFNGEVEKTSFLKKSLSKWL